MKETECTFFSKPKKDKQKNITELKKTINKDSDEDINISFANLDVNDTKEIKPTKKLTPNKDVKLKADAEAKPKAKATPKAKANTNADAYAEAITKAKANADTEVKAITDLIAIIKADEKKISAVETLFKKREKLEADVKKIFEACDIEINKNKLKSKTNLKSSLIQKLLYLKESSGCGGVMCKDGIQSLFNNIDECLPNIIIDKKWTECIIATEQPANKTKNIEGKKTSNKFAHAKIMLLIGPDVIGIIDTSIPKIPNLPKDFDFDNRKTEDFYIGKNGVKNAQHLTYWKFNRFNDNIDMLYDIFKFFVNMNPFIIYKKFGAETNKIYNEIFSEMKKHTNKIIEFTPYGTDIVFRSRKTVSGSENPLKFITDKVGDIFYLDWKNGTGGRFPSSEQITYPHTFKDDINKLHIEHSSNHGKFGCCKDPLKKAVITGSLNNFRSQQRPGYAIIDFYSSDWNYINECFKSI